MPSYRFGNHTAMNMTPRPVADLNGLSATDTLPVGRCVIFAGGQPGIQAAGAHGFVTTADPTVDDPLHFLITLLAGWLPLTMVDWADGRAGINQADPTTWPPPSAALYGISARYQLAGEAAMAGAASDGAKVDMGPEIDAKRVQILWHVAYWDGPLSGVALYSGKKYWFQVVDPEAEPRAAVLRSLTDAELASEQQRHTLFVQNVGSHTDYDGTGKRNVGALQPSSTWDRYYTSAVATAERRRYDANPVIGWFAL